MANRKDHKLVVVSDANWERLKELSVPQFCINDVITELLNSKVAVSAVQTARGVVKK